MPMVLMENPKHGRHNFYSPAEVEAAKLNGWVVVDSAPVVVAAEPEPALEAEPAPAVRRPGRPAANCRT